MNWIISEMGCLRGIKKDNYNILPDGVSMYNQKPHISILVVAFLRA